MNSVKDNPIAFIIAVILTLGFREQILESLGYIGLTEGLLVNAFLIIAIFNLIFVSKNALRRFSPKKADLNNEPQ